MGRPYKRELEELEATFAWAMGQDITTLRKVVDQSADLPLLAVASGGAYAAANFLSQLHLEVFSCVSRSITPFELISSIPSNRDVCVWLLSASGRNVDIRRGLTHALNHEPKQLKSLCLVPSSPLALKAQKAAWPDNLVYTPPTPKDGFLATNSLLAFTVLLGRAYGASDERQGRSLSALMKQTCKSLSAIKLTCSKLLNCRHIVVLYGATTQSAAIDIESRFIEAALGAVQLADLRNFAHGRHHWLKEYGDKTGVLVIYSEEERALATQTLAQLPSSIPTTLIEFKGDKFSTVISSLVVSMHIADWAGDAKGIDPGRPSVPSFGRKLYNLRAPTGHMAHKSRNIAAVQRKLSASGSHRSDSTSERALTTSLKQFRRRIRGAQFPVIVTDYDGTVVDTRFKDQPPSPAIQSEIVRLLQSGITFGVATGRGDSVRDALREWVDRKYWKQVWVGYYSCAQIGRLDDAGLPKKSKIPNGPLKRAYDHLMKMDDLLNIAIIKPSLDQITILPIGRSSPNKVRELAEQCIIQSAVGDVTLVRSGHSVDIMSLGNSKRRIFCRLSEELKVSGVPILAIGDQGRWPGNDFDLLRSSYSLSVDEVSSDHDTCWNLAPSGIRGPDALFYYLSRLVNAASDIGPAVRFQRI